MIRLGLVCLALVILAKPTSAPDLNNLEATKPKVAIKSSTPAEKPHKVVEKPVVEPPKVEQPVVQQERPVEQPKVVTPAIPTDKTELMRLAGIPESDYSHVDYIVQKESSWRHQVWGSPTSLGRAYGLCQALPASKMASEGSDYLTNPITQLKWCHKYATQRYGSWYSAFAFWKSNRWW